MRLILKNCMGRDTGAFFLTLTIRWFRMALRRMTEALHCFGD